MRCEVAATNETKVHHGQNNAMREASEDDNFLREKRHKVLQVDNMPSCCGSSAVGPDSDLQPTGSFVRAQVCCNNFEKNLIIGHQ